MSETRKAKYISNEQFNLLLNYFETRLYRERNRVMLFLAAKAGLRACEIAGLCWKHVLNNDCSDIGETLIITNDISKSHRSKDGKLKKTGGRHFDMSDALRIELRELYFSMKRKPAYTDEIILNQEGYGMTGHGVTKIFGHWFSVLRWKGYSSHSGRRTFITNAARTVTLLGGSLIDVMRLAGHKSLVTTQLYIDPNPEIIKKLVNSI